MCESHYTVIVYQTCVIHNFRVEFICKEEDARHPEIRQRFFYVFYNGYTWNCSIDFPIFDVPLRVATPSYPWLVRTVAMCLFLGLLAFQFVRACEEMSDEGALKLRIASSDDVEGVGIRFKWIRFPYPPIAEKRRYSGNGGQMPSFTCLAASFFLGHSTPQWRDWGPKGNKRIYFCLKKSYGSVS